MCFEFLLFSICGIVVYRFAGQFSTAPGYGSLGARLGPIAAGFTLPTILIVGILYSLVTSRAIFFQVSSITYYLQGTLCPLSRSTKLNRRA